MAKERIMIVEDEAITAEDIKMTLQRAGYQVTCSATTSREAVKRAWEDFPDLIVMDIMLDADMGGITAAEVIRAKYDVPVIYVTSHVDASIIQRAKATEPCAYLTKPFNETELIINIEICLQKAKLGKKLKESEERFRRVAEQIGDGLMIIENDTLVYANNSMTEITGYTVDDLKSMQTFGLVDCDGTDRLKQFEESMRGASRGPFVEEFWIACRGGYQKFIRLSITLLRQDKKDSLFIVVSDITHHKNLEETLASKVSERTQELQIERTNLEEANIALKILVQQKNDYQVEMQERLLSNVKGLIEPLMEKLLNAGLQSTQRNIADILRANIQEIISPFTQNLTSKFCNLTPNEIMVANFVKEGKTSKQIAEAMCISIKTVEIHRGNIRKKLGLQNKKENLRSYLLQLK